jgi:amidohydrolase
MAVSDVLGALERTSRWQEELYAHLHQHPELSMEETQTAAEIERRLSGFGYDVQRVGGGVVGVLVNGEGPTVLMRADIDALPVTEETGLPYASKATAVDASGATVGVMHACGHDVHITAALGAAQLLADARGAWSGTYVALFQPAEETAAGAQAMLDNRLAERIPHPDVALAQHVLAYPASGEVGTRPGPFLSAGDNLKITVFGKGSHGSMPHLGVDPVVLCAAIIGRLQGIISRELEPGVFAVVTIGSVQIGTKSNIIADEGVLLLNMRTYDEGVRQQLRAAIERIVRAECEASRSPREPTFEYYEQYPLTDNDPDVTARVHAAFEAYFGPERVKRLDRLTASEDFSRLPVAFGAPYTYWGFGGFAAGTQSYPNHSPFFGPAMQPTLRTGTEAAVVAALSFFGRGESNDRPSRDRSAEGLSRD